MFALSALSAAFLLATSAGCSSHAKSSAESADQPNLGASPAPVATDDGPIAGYAPVVIGLDARGVLDRAQHGGQVTLVNMWATWCAPCRHEMPALLNVARAHRADGLRLMLVSTDFDDQIVSVRKFLSTQSVNETTYIKMGDDNSFINAIHPKWSGALPATFVYDRSGRLTDFWEGAADENRFEHAVIAALTESTPREASK